MARIPARVLVPAPVRTPARRVAPAPVRTPARRVVPASVRKAITRPRHVGADNSAALTQLRRARRLWRDFLDAEQRRDRQSVRGDQAGVAASNATLTQIDRKLAEVETVIARLDAAARGA